MLVTSSSWYTLLAWLTLLLFASKGFLESWRLCQSITWLRKNSVLTPNLRNLPYIYILMPVLREQRVLKSMIQHFLSLKYPKDKYQIVLITTSKEKHDRESQQEQLEQVAKDLAHGISQSSFINKYLGIFTRDELTSIHRELVKRRLSTIIKRIRDHFVSKETTYQCSLRLRATTFAKDKSQIRVINYPETTGVMAHQINYAVKQLDINDYDDNQLLGIYNADSAPHLETLNAIAALHQNNHDRDVAFQQSSFFLRNINHVKSYFLKAGGVFQSQWTLSHEIPRIRKQVSTSRQRLPKLAHCVGHGMFIRQDIFKKMGGFSTTTMNEDLPFGFKLCAKKIPIIPVPLMESADTPETWRSLFNQKRVWFWGCLDYGKCRYAELHDQPNKQLRINWLTIQGLYYGVGWGANTLLLGIPLLIGLLTSNPELVATTAFVALGILYIPQLITLDQGQRAEYLPPIDMPLNLFPKLVIPLFGIVIYLTDSIGPYLATLDKARHTLFNSQIRKQKTER